MSAKSGSLSIVCIQLRPRKLSVIAECPLFRQGLLIRTEVNGRTVGTFGIVVGYSTCPLLRGVR